MIGEKKMSSNKETKQSHIKENGKMNNYSWTSGQEHEMFYYDEYGKILGTVTKWNNKYKALLDIMFIGFFISE